MNILLLDNYDSFTYNIAHIVRNIEDVNLQIINSDKIVTDDIAKFDGIIFSPGPDIPRPGNAMEKILSLYENKIPVLGICLGLQAITIFYGGKIKKLQEVVHGRTRLIKQTSIKTSIFDGLPQEFLVGLYHSWIADKEELPPELMVTAVSMEGRVMAIAHKKYRIEAVQFHPESIMTQHGNIIIQNWIDSIKIL